MLLDIGALHEIVRGVLTSRRAVSHLSLAQQSGSLGPLHRGFDWLATTAWIVRAATSQIGALR
ncbi:MAG TPA: hypothetical protein VMF89_05350, partial [Polyangiales bacterium]|nr:hypothetical protein [Polyangiales bacterium]